MINLCLWLLELIFRGGFEMEARIVGEILRTKGLPVIKTCEGDESEDGMVALSDKVHVQVGVFDRTVGVVREDGGKFIFYPARTSVRALIPDIRLAIAESKKVAA